MSIEKVLLGIVAGVAVGATLGVLYAPDKGTATRRKITQKRDDYIHDANDMVNEFLTNMTEKFEAMRDEAMQMFENGKEQVGKKVEKVEVELQAAANNAKAR